MYLDRAGFHLTITVAFSVVGVELVRRATKSVWEHEHIEVVVCGGEQKWSGGPRCR